MKMLNGSPLLESTLGCPIHRARKHLLFKKSESGNKLVATIRQESPHYDSKYRIFAYINSTGHVKPARDALCMQFNMEKMGFN